jgi:hypothetical protein
MNISSVAKIAFGLVVLIFAIAAVVIFYKFGVSDPKISLLKDIIFLGVSTYIAYALALFISKDEYKRELEKLGDLSARRVNQLTVNLRKIARQISRQDHQSSLMQELLRLAEDGDQSVTDIRIITGFDAATKTEYVHCPNCGNADSASLAKHVGATDSHTCTACTITFNLHRVANGIKIKPLTIPSKSFRLVGQIPTGGDPTPNEEGNHSSSPSSISLPSNNSVEENGYVQFNCPNSAVCTNVIKLRPKPNEHRKSGLCPECVTEYIFDLPTRTVTSSGQKNALEIKIESNRNSACPSCGKAVTYDRLFIRNKKGWKYGWCESCLRLLVNKPSE